MANNIRIKKADAKAMIEKFDSMPPGPEKNKFWDKLVPYANAYPELYYVGKRAKKEEKIIAKKEK